MKINNDNKFFDRVRWARFGKIKVVKKEFYVAK